MTCSGGGQRTPWRQATGPAAVPGSTRPVRERQDFYRS